MSKNPGLVFPCSFPIKVMGLNSDAFSSAVYAVMNSHLEQGGYTVESKLSRGSKYLSLTITFTAESREQLDAIYQDLNARKEVLMSL